MRPPHDRDPMSARHLSRRALLQASLAGGLALVAAACASPTRSPLASASVPNPTPTGAASPSDATPGATPTPAAATPTAPPATQAPVSLEALVRSLLVVGFRGSTLKDGGWVARALGDGLGGVILFDRDQETGGLRNVRSPAQVRRLTADIRAAAGRTPVIAIDQEGGLVTRLSPKHGYPAVASEAVIGAGTTAHARRWAKALAATLADAGVTLNLAPVVDLDVNPSSPAIGALGRSFSADADVVVRMAGIEVAAHRAAGVATALKHFPGIGELDRQHGQRGRGRHPDVAPRGARAVPAADRGGPRGRGDGRPRPERQARPASACVAVASRRHGPAARDPRLGGCRRDGRPAGGRCRVPGPAEAGIRALEAGADLLLFANQQGYDAGIVDAVTAAIVDAVHAGRLDRSAIEASAGRIGALFPG